MSRLAKISPFERSEASIAAPVIRTSITPPSLRTHRVSTLETPFSRICRYTSLPTRSNSSSVW